MEIVRLLMMIDQHEQTVAISEKETEVQQL